MEGIGKYGDNYVDYSMKRYAGMKLNEIAVTFFLKYPSVSANYKNFIKQADKSENIRKMKEKM